MRTSLRRGVRGVKRKDERTSSGNKKATWMIKRDKVRHVQKEYLRLFMPIKATPAFDVLHGQLMSHQVNGKKRQNRGILYKKSGEWGQVDPQCSPHGVRQLVRRVCSWGSRALLSFAWSLALPHEDIKHGLLARILSGWGHDRIHGFSEKRCVSARVLLDVRQ